MAEDDQPGRRLALGQERAHAPTERPPDQRDRTAVLGDQPVARRPQIGQLGLVAAARTAAAGRERHAGGDDPGFPEAACQPPQQRLLGGAAVARREHSDCHNGLTISTNSGILSLPARFLWFRGRLCRLSSVLLAGRQVGGQPVPRQIWKGVITFGMVSIPVGLYAATESKDVAFHQLHKPCNSRLKQRRWCPVCEADVEMAEVVKGYEYSKDQY